MDFKEVNQVFDAEFKVDGRLTQFRIYHNLPETEGLDPESALICWLARTEKCTAKSFCKYVRGKDKNFIAFTESRFNKMLKVNDCEVCVRENND